MARTPKKPKDEAETADTGQSDENMSSAGPESEAEERILTEEPASDSQPANMSEPYALADDVAADKSAENDDIVVAEDEKAQPETVDMGGEGERAPGTLPNAQTSETTTTPVVTGQSGTGASPLLMILGGAIAAGLGWLAATFTADAPVLPNEPSTEVSSELAAQAARVEDLANELSGLREEAAATGGSASDETAARLESVEASLADAVTSLGARLDGVEGQATTQGASDEDMSAINTRIDELGERVATLESAEPQTPDGSAAMEAQLEEFRAQLDSVTADAERQIEEARSRATEIEQQAAMQAEEASRSSAIADIRAALQSGEAYAEPMSNLSNVPDALASHAENGVPTLATLQDSFPATARAALAEAQTVPEDAGTGERFTAFLRRQTNARSLSPRDGNDTDAILSRAEAALREGDLSAALQEVDTLEGAPAEAMQDWQEQARSREEALNGFAALTEDEN